MPEKKLIMVPGPTNVPDRVMRAMMKPMISHRSEEFRVLYRELTGNLKYLFQTRGDVYVLASSGTGGVECAVSNIVDPGDKVLVPVFGLFSERLKESVKRRGGEVIELSLEWGDAPSVEQISQVLDCTEDLKAIAIVYNETSTGVTVRDLPKIAEEAKRRGILLLVDAVSILGGDKLPVDDWQIDICVTGSQKCLACPPGLALISVSDDAWNLIEETSRPFYYDLVQMRRFNEKYETPFTPALPLLYALDEALRMIREEGLENRFRRHRICSEAFYNAIEDMGLNPIPIKEEYRSNTVIAFRRPEEVDGATVRRLMDERYGVVIAGGAGKMKGEAFRIGCMGIVSPAEVIQTVIALREALIDQGFKLDVGSGLEAALKTFNNYNYKI